MTHNALYVGAVLHHADLPALPSGVRLQVPQGTDLLLHQQHNYIPLPLLGLLSKGLQEDRKNGMKIRDRSETIADSVLSFRSTKTAGLRRCL